MAEPVFGFDEKGTRRVVDMVRRLELMVRNQHRQWEQATIPRKSSERYLSKNDSGNTWSKGSTVTATLYSGNTPGSETASTITFNNVYVRLGDISNGKWCYIESMQGTIGFEVVNAEC